MRIITLIVEQNSRQIGVGKKLVALAEEFAIKNHCSHIELTSGVHREALGSHDFYKKLGYNDLCNSKKYFGKLLPLKDNQKSGKIEAENKFFDGL